MEIYKILENIARITYEIQIIYIRLTLLEVSKDIEDNYESKKKNYLEQLELLKMEEDEAYDPLTVDYTTITAALEIFNKLQGQEVSEKMECCQKRIYNRLQIIAHDCGMSENSDEFMESFLEDEYFTKLYFDRGFDKDMLLTYIEKVYKPTNLSLSRHYLGTLDLALNDPKNFDIRRLLINLKFDYIFQKGEQLETEYLKNSFHTPGLFLKDEIDSINVPDKNDYFDFKITDQIIFNLLPVFAAVEEKELVLSEIAWFKTYLLFLSDKAIKKVKETVNSYSFNSNDIKEILINIISDLDHLKKSHNQSKEQFTL